MSGGGQLRQRVENAGRGFEMDDDDTGQVRIGLQRLLKLREGQLAIGCCFDYHRLDAISLENLAPAVAEMAVDAEQDTLTWRKNRLHRGVGRQAA
jgi:hypothetical protein